MFSSFRTFSSFRYLSYQSGRYVPTTITKVHNYLGIIVFFCNFADCSTCDIAWLYHDAHRFGIYNYQRLVGENNVVCPGKIGAVLESSDPDFIKLMQDCPRMYNPSSLKTIHMNFWTVTIYVKKIFQTLPCHGQDRMCAMAKPIQIKTMLRILRIVNVSINAMLAKFMVMNAVHQDWSLIQIS